MFEKIVQKKDLQEATFVKRYKRFLVDMNINGKIVTCYCPNPGKMADILIEGSSALLVRQFGCKYEFRWIAIQIDNVWIGVDTHIPNKVMKILLPKLYPESPWSQEVKYDDCRFDFKNDQLLVEVKNVHWKLKDIAFFPDCVTARGTKHLTALSKLSGNRMLVYVVQRSDVAKCSVAGWIDPSYKDAMDKFTQSGGKVLVISLDWSKNGIVSHKIISYIES